MNTSLLSLAPAILTMGLFQLGNAEGDQPAIVIDHRPEEGVPSEALAQAKERGEMDVQDWHTMTDGIIKSVRIRYYNKETWSTDDQVREYVAAFLACKKQSVYSYQVWSQGVGVPEIECLVEFTDEHRRNLKTRSHVGRLLIWHTESCFRDATGTWWFINTFDHFHSAHPKGNRELEQKQRHNQ